MQSAEQSLTDSKSEAYLPKVSGHVFVDLGLVWECFNPARLLNVCLLASSLNSFPESGGGSCAVAVAKFPFEFTFPL